MAVWIADSVVGDQNKCGDMHQHSPSYFTHPHCGSFNVTFESPTQTHCNECGRNWYYTCKDCGSDNGYFVDPDRTGYIAPLYFCIPENTVKQHLHVTGEPTRRQAKKKRHPVQPVQPGPSQQARAHRSKFSGKFAEASAYFWAFFAFGVFAVIIVASVDPDASGDLFWGTFSVGGLIGLFLTRTAMRRSSRRGWFLVIAALILAAFLLFTIE